MPTLVTAVIVVLASVLGVSASYGQPTAPVPPTAPSESQQGEEQTGDEAATEESDETATEEGDEAATEEEDIDTPPPPPPPPDGILPVSELARIELSPRDRPRALLYGTHLLIVGRSGFVEGYDAETGEFAWKLGLPGEALFDPLVFDAGPLVEGETDALTVVLSEPSGHLLLVDGLTGKIQQETRLPFELALPPVRGPGDIVFFATPSGDVVAYDVRQEEVTFQTATGETPLALASTDSLLVVSGALQTLTALDLPEGKLRWTFRGRAGFFAPAAFDEQGSRVYVGDDTGELYCLDAVKGDVKFRWSTGAAIRHQVLVEGRRLYLASWANSLFAFNALSGDEHWRTNLPGRPATKPMRVRNRLLVGTYDGILIEIEPSRGSPGERYVAPGEIVVAPSFYLAKPSPAELDAAEGSEDLITATEGPEDEPTTMLDPEIFGPEELMTPEADVDELEPDQEELVGDAVPEIPREPAWFERSRVAMALRSGEVLLLAHQVPEATTETEGEGDGDDDDEEPDADGEDETEIPRQRPPTSPP